MATTYAGEQVTVHDLALLAPAERIEQARVHEAAACVAIDNAPDRRGSVDDPPSWPLKAIMNREVVAHLAYVGEEDAARGALKRIRVIAPEDIFKGRLAILRAFDRPEDYEEVKASAGSNSKFAYPLDSTPELQVVRYALEQEIEDDLPEYVAHIPEPTARTIGRIMIAPDAQEIVAIRDGYQFESRPTRKPEAHFEFNPGKAHVNLAAALYGPPEVHPEVVSAVTELGRPDFVHHHVSEYVRRLLENDQRDKVEDIVQAVTRDDDPIHRIHMLGVIAATTQADEDIDRFEAPIRGLGNPFIIPDLLADLAQIYADKSDMSKTEALVREVRGIDPLYAHYGQRLARLELLRAYLIVGAREEAEVAYRSATFRFRGFSDVVAARLMVARYIRTGHPAQATLTF